ncbi:hypothetical protein KM043_010853 [Ampulex compressa]|nr:hypothetical protein KM043_010853 [Ampulex compressa]
MPYFQVSNVCTELSIIVQSLSALFEVKPKPIKTTDGSPQLQSTGDYRKREDKDPFLVRSRRFSISQFQTSAYIVKGHALNPDGAYLSLTNAECRNNRRSPIGSLSRRAG